MFSSHRQRSSQTGRKVVCRLPRSWGIHSDRKRELASGRYVELGLTGNEDGMVMTGWGRGQYFLEEPDCYRANDMVGAVMTLTGPFRGIRRKAEQPSMRVSCLMSKISNMLLWRRPEGESA